MSKGRPVAAVVEADEDDGPLPLIIDADDLDNNVEFVQEIGLTEGHFGAPIDIDVTGSTRIDLPLLEWHHYNDMPKKILLTNSGRTCESMCKVLFHFMSFYRVLFLAVILSAKWAGPRPYLTGGSLNDSYVLSQIHFHWGASATDGSEHTVDATRQPLELHAIHFKRSYLNHSMARTKNDGIICLCYLFQIRSYHSDTMHPIVSVLRDIRMADTQISIQPFVMTRLLYPFEYDYFMYWGRCAASNVLWFVCRHTESLSFEQLCLFRQLLDDKLRPIVRNWRELNCRNGRRLLHVNAAVAFTNTTMAPVPLRLDPSREVLCPPHNEEEEKECRLRLAKWDRRQKIAAPPEVEEKIWVV